MARRKKPEEHENHERWLVSYADFITLLFAFFVVMYAISSVNEGKYRTLAHSLVAAFQNPPRALQPIQVGELARSKDQPAMKIQQTPHNMELPERLPDILENKLPEQTAAEAEQANSGADQAQSEALREMAQRIVEQMEPLIEQELITVRQTDFWLEVEINTSILFPSGSDRLSPRARGVLEQIAAVLRDFPNPIRVEGFTDSRPIQTAEYESNWELSAERAARVVRLFTEAGVEPRRLAAVGFGEHRPVASNDTPEGRRRNRRVALVILAGQDTRYLIDVARGTSEIGVDADTPGKVADSVRQGRSNPQQSGEAE